MKKLFEKIDYIDLFLWLIRAVIIIIVIWGTVATILDNPYSRRQWTDFVIFGVAQGSMYALIAIGYTLVYGVLFMINFAHGEFFMSGIMTSTVFIAGPMAKSGFLNRHPIISLLIIALFSMLVSIGVAVLTERIAYKPLRKAPRLVPLITAIGASLFWQNFYRGMLGSNVKPFPQVDILAGSIPLLGTQVLKTLLVTIIMLIGLNFFIMRTKTGRSIRAVSEDKDVAALMGIDVDRAITITFATGAAMAGIAGVLFALVSLFHGFYARDQSLYGCSPGRDRQRPWCRHWRPLPGLVRIDWTEPLLAESWNSRFQSAEGRDCLHYVDPRSNFPPTRHPWRTLS